MLLYFVEPKPVRSNVSLLTEQLCTLLSKLSKYRLTLRFLNVSVKSNFLLYLPWGPQKLSPVTLPTTPRATVLVPPSAVPCSKLVKILGNSPRKRVFPRNMRKSSVKISFMPSSSQGLPVPLVKEVQIIHKLFLMIPKLLKAF